MVLEDRGVGYAMPASDKPCSTDQYQKLADEYNCTRLRLFGVPTSVGTLNKTTERGLANTSKGVHPKGRRQVGRAGLMIQKVQLVLHSAWGGGGSSWRCSFVGEVLCSRVRSVLCPRTVSLSGGRRLCSDNAAGISEIIT